MSTALPERSSSAPAPRVDAAKAPWQLKMFARTLKKKLRFRVLRDVLGTIDGRECLLITCGDNNGAINYRLRDLGGKWTWADCETTSIAEMAQLLGEPVHHVAAAALPFDAERFDCVVTIDVHEHLPAPGTFTREIERILKPHGRAIVTVPGNDPDRLVNRLKRAVGMRREDYGHVRDGFTVHQLESLLRERHIEPLRSVTFSRFFTELVELVINYLYVKKLSRQIATTGDARTIAPATAAQLRAVSKTYRLYSLVYPLVWLFSRLDLLLFFTPGHVVMVEGRRVY